MSLPKPHPLGFIERVLHVGKKKQVPESPCKRGAKLYPLRRKVDLAVLDEYDNEDLSFLMHRAHIGQQLDHTGTNQADSSAECNAR
jgi:hypothetical protein